MSKEDNTTTKPFYNTTIPRDWEVKKVFEVCGFIVPDRNKPELSIEGIPWITTPDLVNGSDISFSKSNLFVSKEYAKNANLKIVPVNSVIMTCVGDIGIVALTKHEIIINQQLHAFIPSNLIDSRFLLNSLANQRKYFEKVATKTAVPYLNKDNCNSTPILIPSLTEQRAISNVLSLMDSAINQNNQLIIQKQLQKKWLMQNLLTGKKRVNGFGEDWKEYSFEKLLKVVKRPFEWNEDELYKLISVRRRSGGIFFRESLLGHQILVKNLRTVNEGDFLFSKMQILHGASALVSKEFAGAKISGSYIAVVAKDKNQLNMEFFQWYSQMKYFYHQTFISSYGVLIEKMTFDFEIFLQLEMKLPSYKEQTAITRVLQAADKEIQLLKAKTDKLREQKKGMMQVLLTGKKRLKIN